MTVYLVVLNPVNNYPMVLTGFQVLGDAEDYVSKSEDELEIMTLEVH